MDKVKMTTPDGVTENIEKLGGAVSCRRDRDARRERHPAQGH